MAWTGAFGCATAWRIHGGIILDRGMLNALSFRAHKIFCVKECNFFGKEKIL